MQVLVNGVARQHLLDIRAVIEAPDQIAAAAVAARAGVPWELEGEWLSVFDTRAPRPARDSGIGASPCVLVCARSGLRFALLVD
jgi:hypothetical protein